MSVIDLWLPILLAGVATHIASTLAWTVLKHHDPEWQEMPSEGELMNFIEEKQTPTGQYIFPFCKDMKKLASEEFQEKLRNGCKGMLVLWPNPPNMPKAIISTLTYFMVVSFMTGYAASIAFEPGASSMDVFRLVFIIGILCHTFSPLPHTFWFPRKYMLEMVDGVVYALVTAGIFAALWPGPSA